MKLKLIEWLFTKIIDSYTPAKSLALKISLVDKFVKLIGLQGTKSFNKDASSVSYYLSQPETEK